MAMEPLHSIGMAGDFIVVKTDFGEHTRRQWARTTIGQIVQIDAEATPDRVALLLKLKQAMVEAIEPYFGKSLDADGPFTDLLAVVRGTPWEMSFQHPAVRTQIFRLLNRNLASARKGN